MKGFIRGILLAVVLALPIHGCMGEMVAISELANQENALLEWNQTYEVHGRTIQINVPVIIPVVDHFPIIQVSAWMGSEVVENLELVKAKDQTNAGIHEVAGSVCVLSYSTMSQDSAFFARSVLRMASTIGISAAASCSVQLSI